MPTFKHRVALGRRIFFLWGFFVRFWYILDRLWCIHQEYITLASRVLQGLMTKSRKGRGDLATPAIFSRETDFYSQGIRPSAPATVGVHSTTQPPTMGATCNHRPPLSRMRPMAAILSALVPPTNSDLSKYSFIKGIYPTKAGYCAVNPLPQACFDPKRLMHPGVLPTSSTDPHGPQNFPPNAHGYIEHAQHLSLAARAPPFYLR